MVRRDESIAWVVTYCFVICQDCCSSLLGIPDEIRIGISRREAFRARLGEPTLVTWFLLRQRTWDVENMLYPIRSSPHTVFLRLTRLMEPALAWSHSAAEA